MFKTFCTFWRLKFTKLRESIQSRVPKTHKQQFYNYLILQHWFHVKSEWEKISDISSLWNLHPRHYLYTVFNSWQHCHKLSRPILIPILFCFLGCPQNPANKKIWSFYASYSTPLTTYQYQYRRIPTILFIPGLLVVYQFGFPTTQCGNFRNFSVTRILREIKVCVSRVLKSAILTRLEALNFDFHEFLRFLKFWNCRFGHFRASGLCWFG